MSVPVLYDHMNALIAMNNPGVIHKCNTVTFEYFKRYLIQKAMSVYKWTLPDDWDEGYFLYTLYTEGRICVVKTDKFGVIPQQCGLSGYNVFYRPTKAIVTNPLFRKSYTLDIGWNTEIIKLQKDWGGFMDLVNFHAGRMALFAEAIDMNLVNSKLSYIFGAQNKAAAESMKKAYDEIQSGRPAVFIDKQLLNDQGEPSWMPWSQNVGQNYIVDRLLADMRKEEAIFDTIVGIPNANTDKRERLISDEVNANNTETQTLSEMWLDSLTECCEKVNNMFGTSISVDWRHQPIMDEEPLEVVAYD